MRDMFYNYEHNIDKKDCLPPPFIDFPKNAEGYYGADLVFNAKGDCIGVKAKEDSDFDLFFTLDGFVEGSDIYSLLNSASFVLDIISSKNKLVASITPEVFDEHNLKAHIEAHDGLIPADIYGMRLTMFYNEKEYAIFKESDAILRII